MRNSSDTIGNRTCDLPTCSAVPQLTALPRSPTIQLCLNIFSGQVAYSVQRLATGWTVRRSKLVGAEIFRTCPDRPWGPSNLLQNGYQVFPGVKSSRGVTLTPHPLLVPWSRKGRAISLLPLWAVRPVQSLSACTRVHFTLPLPYSEVLWRKNGRPMLR